MDRWRGNGGWIPVVRHRNGGGSKRSESSFGLFSIFVDNLPQSMDVRSLFKLFTKFGIVKDAYIPFKRRVATNSRFGFVSFGCSVAADIAIQKANGLLVDDRELEVKKATHERGSRAEHSKRRSQPMSRFSGTGNIRGHPSGAGQKSYAEVLKGKNPVVAGTVSTAIKVDEVGHGWLYESAIIRLKNEYSLRDIRTVLKEKGLDQVLVRKGGGRDVILTFNSQVELNSKICNIKEWFKDYSQSVGVWKPDFHYEPERCLWLRCYGVPLNFWNRNTFNNIGNLWGTVLSLDGDTTHQKSFSYAKIRLATPYMEPINKTIFLECKGQLYHILVCEDHIADINILKHNGEVCSSIESYSSKEEENIYEENSREKNEDDEVAAQCGKPIAELACDNMADEVVAAPCGKPIAELACDHMGALANEPSACHNREKGSTVVEET
ncbi:uncharacterized protein LOC114310208 [Camellia sinensis]|uniref:uncharacterized protein LOC114310208 n=1 Tax=Camellia sinensis TaxID=4442 RepID=UPI001035E4B7|nr:uncharacterized protein LOC114310208 [Camellia sinensis]